MNDAFNSVDVNCGMEVEDVESIEEVNAENDESNLFLLIEEKPPVQFGINNQNLDNVYHGHLPASFGVALRKWIWGVNGLAFEMILPLKSIDGGRTCASKESMLKFFRKFFSQNRIFSSF